MITIPLETAIQGRNFIIPIPREEISMPANPKVAINAVVTKMPTNPALVNLLTKINLELLLALNVAGKHGKATWVKKNNHPSTECKSNYHSIYRHGPSSFFPNIVLGNT
jgi:hypothetical protein